MSAQTRFENVRRQYLLRVDRTGAGRCDRRIGRLCYWYDPSSSPPPHEEHERITEARQRLLAELAELLAKSPGDGWIRGQRVRYLVEAGLPDSAHAEARRCAAEAWWCEALGAFALHAGGHAESDRAFGRALELAPDEVRCEWTSVELLLPDRMRRDYRDSGCGAQRDSVAELLWWLSNPRFARTGNELRAEHYSRFVMSRLHDGARNAYGLRWGSDLEELLLRYGWSRQFTRAFPRMGEVSPPVSGHEPAPSFHFVPVAEAFGQPLEVGDDLWELERADAPTRYAPPWATRLRTLDAQVAAFRRGPQALIVAAFTLPPELATTGWHAELGASTGPGAGVTAAAAADSSDHGVLVVRSPLERMLVGLDVMQASAAALLPVAGGTRRDTLVAARTRISVSPPGAAGAPFAISSPLLVAPPSEAPRQGAPHVTLDSVLPRIIGRSTLRAPGSVEIYWETYGLPPGRTALQMTLVLRGGERGWLRRLGDRITGRTVAEPPLLAWTDVANVPEGVDHPVVGRSVTIELPRLEPGSYALEIRAVRPDGSDAASVRLLEVIRQE